MRSQEEIIQAVANLTQEIATCREALEVYENAKLTHTDTYGFWQTLERDYSQRLAALEWVLGTWNDQIV